MPTRAPITPTSHVDPRVRRTREQVIAAARALLLDNGPDAITMEAVAERSGVARSTVYRHWQSRTDLLEELLRSLAWHITEPDPTADPGARLRDVVRQFARHLADPVQRSVVTAIMHSLARSEELVELGEALRGAHPATLRPIIEDAINSGLLRSDVDPREVMVQILGPLTLAAMTAPEKLDDAFADRVTDLTMRGHRV